MDVAASLVLERGYDAVSMDNVASNARVGRATLYEHWSTRDDMFVALVHREQDGLAADLVAAHDNTFRELMRRACLAILQRPLLVAILTADTAVWGRRLQQLSATEIYQARLSAFARVPLCPACRGKGSP